MRQLNENLKEKCGVYIITNIENGKRYIGSSSNIRKRLYDHIYHLNNNIHDNPHLQSSWKKHGEELFEYGILCYCDSKEIFELEQKYIDLLLPEYNIQLKVIGVEGSKRTKETREKISNSIKSKYKDGFRNTKYDYTVYIYDIISWKLVGIFDTLRKASVAIYGNTGTGLTYDTLNKKLAKSRYIFSITKFKILEDLLNYASENILTYNHSSPLEKTRWLIIDDGNKIRYFRSVADAKKYMGNNIKCATTTFRRNIKCNQNNPYKIVNSKFSFYTTTTFIPHTNEAVPIEESLELLSSKNGES